MSISAVEKMSLYGVVYDVGLNFGGKNLSVEHFRPEQVAYDMSIIRHVLNCNTVRIEGEDFDRLSFAIREASKQGLKVLFKYYVKGKTESMLYTYELHKTAKVNTSGLHGSLTTWD